MIMTRTSLRARQSGFTFIELMIVVAVLATIAGVAVPGFAKNKKTLNESSAVDAVGDFVTAENMFKAGVGNSSFGSAKELWQEGLLDHTLASGRDVGYHFTLNVSGDGQHFDVTACPAAVGRSGGKCFTADEAGVIVTTCPPGQHPDPFTGDCVPEDTYVFDAGIAIIQAVDAISGGTALPAMKTVAELVPNVTQQLLMFLDADHDGMLAADEILNADMLGPTLRPLIAPLTDALRRDMALGIANEQLTGVPIATISGNILDFLNAVPPFSPPGGARR
jgi:prepilin-type N-terminal cleavage/methylation domain-containing protein